MACSMDGAEKCIQYFGGEVLGKEPLERHRHRWRLILKWIFDKWDGRHRLDSSGLG
jgi:hypothetical protein